MPRKSRKVAAVDVQPNIGDKPIVPLYAYQQRWLADKSRYAAWVKSVQIGATFAEAVRVVERRLEMGGMQLYFNVQQHLRKEFIRKCKEICQGAGAIAELREDVFLEVGETKYLTDLIEFPNGGRILALPATPNIASLTGDATWDEEARTEFDREVLKGISARITRGFQFRRISSPYGIGGTFHDLATQLGLDKATADGSWRPAQNPVSVKGWSGHWTDAHLAIEEGCTSINLEELRSLYLGDDDGWAENLLCVFLSSAGSVFSPEDIAACTVAAGDPLVGTQLDLRAGALNFLGADIGRKRDLYVKTVGEKSGDVVYVRKITELRGARFTEMQQDIRDDAPLCGWGCIDSSGLGMETAERMKQEFSQMEGVQFTNEIKHRLVDIGKEAFELRRVRIPNYAPLISSLRSIKLKKTEAGNFVFDAATTDMTGHADYAWSLLLMLMAAKTGANYVPASDCGTFGDTVMGNLMEKVF